MTKSRSNATAPNAKGTLVVGSGTDASTTLAVGTNNYVLTADSAEASGVKWAAAGGFTGCLLYLQNASVSFTQNVTKIFDGWSETLDTDSFHSTSTNTSRITIPAGLGGKYRVYGVFNSSTADKSATVKLYKNGSQLNENGIYVGEVWNRLSGDRPALSFTNYIDFSAGDYLEYGILSNFVTGTYGVYAQFAVERIAS